MSTKLLTLFTLALLTFTCFAGKRGLAWPWNGQGQDFNLFINSSSISWVYNWELWRPGSFPTTKFSYVAMQRTASGIGNLPAYFPGNGASVLLGFNEPDISSQANMSPDTAVGYWPTFNSISQQYGLRIGSPGISNGGNGLPWLQEFMTKCVGCKIDFIHCHWYGPNFNHFKAQIESVHAAFPNLPIWVTEFALQGSPTASQQAAFMTEAMAYLDSASFVERYSWFGAFRGSSGNCLIDNNGAITPLGVLYSS